MGSSKRKSRQQMTDVADEEPEVFAVRNILEENKTRYLVDWEDIGSQKFDPTWEPKHFVTRAAIQEWEELKEERKRKRKSTAGRPPSRLEDDEDESEQQSLTTTTASGLKLKLGKLSRPVVEVTPPASRVSEPAKKSEPRRPRESHPGEDKVAIAPKTGKRPVGRPRKSHPPPAEEEEEKDDTEASGRSGIKLKIPGKRAKSSPSTGSKRKRQPSTSKVVNISSDDDSDAPVSKPKRQRIVPDSSDQVQPAAEEVQHVAPRKRGRPRKHALPASSAPSPMTPVVASRTEEVETTEIEDSEMYDAAAAQLQRETRSARKQSPRRQPSPRQSPVRQPSPEFDEDVSDFRSSQIVRGTQPEPPGPEQLTDSQSMVDAAAASSLSVKNLPYEPEATSGSTFDNTTVNSSSGVHTIRIPLTRRFGPDAVISDSQSYLDGSSLHISDQHIQAAADNQMEHPEDATTESQIVVEPEVAEQMITQDLPVPESSMVQKPEDAPQSDVAAPATQSEPSLERSTRNNTGAEAAASSPVPQGIQQHVSTRSPSPVSLGAARSSSTSSAPPTEAADKSTQSQSQSQSQPQNQSPPKSSSQNKGPVETFSSHLSAPNQESGQNTLSVDPRVTTQQSHVEQAAQEVSFQQPPTQQRPTLDFVQSSAEEPTTSSLRFDTQIPPAQHVLTQGVSITSSPIASLPSHLLDTIGGSAPSPIKSISELSRQQTPSSNMTPELNPDGTPKRESMASRLRTMRATNKARREAEAREEAERATSAHAVTSTPVTSRVAAPVLDMHSPKPASAVPARLMSPAITDREARSPSTVPPVEIIPEETPEQSSRSERYETLLPGQGPQINTETSRPYVSQDLTMFGAFNDTEPDNNQHLVSLEFEVLQRDHYKCAFDDHKVMIESFTLNGVLPADTDLAQQARDLIVQLHCIVNHLDLNNPETSTSSQMTTALQAEWDMSMSSKFRFLKSLLDVARRHNLHVALLVDPGRLAAMLQGFLQGINIMYNVIDGKDNVINQKSTATILLTSVESIDITSLDMDMIAVIDGTMHKDIITRTQKMLSRDTLVPTISLVIPHSIEHAEHCLPPAMPEAERLHVLISTATGERLNAGWQSSGTDRDFDRKASDIISWILNPAEADWPFYGLPSLQLIEGLSQSLDEELMVDSGSNKRPLQDDSEVSTLAKRARVDEPLPLTINPADMHLAPGTIPTNSHVSDSVAASQHAITLQELNRAQAQVREHIQAMEALQYSREEQRGEMIQAQKERNEALRREEKLRASNIDLRAKNDSLRDEVLDLKKQLEAANATMLEHAVPERAELEKSKAEALAAVAEREKEAKRAKTFEEQLEYTRSQYQDRSNQISMLATSNDEYVKRIAELEVKASGEQARLKSINNDSLVKKYDSTIKQLRTVVAEREGTMQRMSEELTRLREPRGRVGTRASSIPRSPRAGTREPVSRQGSPSVQRPHPLRKEN